MKSPLTLPFLTLLCALLRTTAADDCQPWTWTWDVAKARAAAATPIAITNTTTSASAMPTVTSAPGRKAVPKPGDVNCRDWGATYDLVGYWSCNQLAQDYGIAIEKFWELNPGLAPDCEGVKPYTEYCVAGCKCFPPLFRLLRSIVALINSGLCACAVIEPLRSTDGFCGPKHNNATCVGSDFGQCCNAETWKCGETEYVFVPFQQLPLNLPPLSLSQETTKELTCFGAAV
jgi:hypothetical protein